MSHGGEKWLGLEEPEIRSEMKWKPWLSLREILERERERERERKKGQLMMESPRCEIYARHKKYEDS